MDDQWEMDDFGTTARDGQGDFDMDNGNDLFEFLTGTNPTDPFSLFRVDLEVATAPHTGTALSWPTRAWGIYRVQYKEQLTDPIWQNLPANVTLLGGKGLATDPTPANGARVYRVELAD